MVHLSPTPFGAKPQAKVGGQGKMVHLNPTPFGAKPQSQGGRSGQNGSPEPNPLLKWSPKPWLQTTFHAVKPGTLYELNLGAKPKKNGSMFFHVFHVFHVLFSMFSMFSMFFPFFLANLSPKA